MVEVTGGTVVLLVPEYVDTSADATVDLVAWVDTCSVSVAVAAASVLPPIDAWLAEKMVKIKIYIYIISIP